MHPLLLTRLFQHLSGRPVPPRNGLSRARVPVLRGQAVTDTRIALLLLLVGGHLCHSCDAALCGVPIHLVILLGCCAACPGRVTDDADALSRVGGEAFFAGLLKDDDPHVRLFASSFLLQRLMAAPGGAYRRALRHLLSKVRVDPASRPTCRMPGCCAAYSASSLQVCQAEVFARFLCNGCPVLVQAQQADDEKLLANPYIQVSNLMDLRLIDF